VVKLSPPEGNRL